MQSQQRLSSSWRAVPAAPQPHQPRTRHAAAPALARRCSCVAASSSSSSSSSSSEAQPSTSSTSPPAAQPTDWSARRKARVVADLVEASKRLGPAFTPDAIRAGVTSLEQLLPGLEIDVERLKASDWARLVVGINDTANKIILLKSLYPRADLTRIVQLAPGTLLEESATLQANARQVKQLLASAKQPDELLTALPSLLDPHICISVIVTVRKWYFNKRDPIEVLEADPDLIRRAQASGVPFEPVWVDPVTGAWEAPGFDYLNKRAPWQQYLDEKNKGGGYLTGVGEAILEEKRQAREQAEAAEQAAAAAAEQQQLAEAAGQAPAETVGQQPGA